eukprot:351721-Chlamydomonas_euryale.AAC.3
MAQMTRWRRGCGRRGATPLPARPSSGAPPWPRCERRRCLCIVCGTRGRVKGGKGERMSERWLASVLVGPATHVWPAPCPACPTSHVLHCMHRAHGTGLVHAPFTPSTPEYSIMFLSGRTSSRRTNGRPLMYTTGSSRMLTHSAWPQKCVDMQCVNAGVQKMDGEERGATGRNIGSSTGWMLAFFGGCLFVAAGPLSCLFGRSSVCLFIWLACLRDG